MTKVAWGMFGGRYTLESEAKGGGVSMSRLACWIFAWSLLLRSILTTMHAHFHRVVQWWWWSGKMQCNWRCNAAWHGSGDDVIQFQSKLSCASRNLFVFNFHTALL